MRLIASAIVFASATLAAQGWPTNQPTPSTPMAIDVSGTIHPPVMGAAVTGWIDQFCGWQWGGDRERRKFCTDQERESHAGLMLGTDTPRDIRNDCAGKWPVSFTMRLACENVARRAKGLPMVFASSPAAALNSSPAGGSDMPTLATAMGGIKAKCAKDFPDDFATQKYCIDRQGQSLEKLRARTMTAGDRRTIRAKCQRDFPDDFATMDYCEERQLKALSEIR